MLIDLINSKEMAIIDEDDFEIVKPYKWRISNCGYAVTYKNKTLILMHRLIFYGLDSKGKSRIDHKDGNRINNSKLNIRVSTPSQNTMNKHCLMSSNKSGYNGVKWSNKEQRWEASIGFNNRRIFGGYYDDKYEAAIAYDILSAKYFGEFAFINIKNPDKNIYDKILARMNNVKKNKRLIYLQRSF